MREKIAGRLLLLDPALADALPPLLDFLGVPDPERPLPRLDPEVRQHRLFEAMKRLTHARSRREAGVSLFEDLHWIDGASEAFLANLVEAVAGTRTLVVVSFRPEYDAAWMRSSYYQRLALLPLGPVAIAELLADLLGTHPSLAGLGERIRTRTGGNPFFIEEIVQALVEAGSLAGTKGAYRLARPVAELALPPTVQAVLAARIDRLPAREKEVLGTAAVIGKAVPGLILKRVAALPQDELSAAVAELVSREFLYETALYPEAEYAFKHPLTQEVAYRSQLAERRKAVHAAVARAIEGFYADRLGEHAALLAQHWEGADEALVAADWHRRAAEWVGARDRGEMSRHWQRVRALLDAVPESSETLAMGVFARTHLLNNGTFLGQADDEAAALFAEGLALASRLDGPAPRIVLLSSYGMSRLVSGAVDEALAHLTESLRLADQSGNTVLQFTGRLGLALALQFAGQLREAVAVSDEAERLGGGDPEFGALRGFGVSSAYGLVLTYRAHAPSCASGVRPTSSKASTSGSWPRRPSAPAIRTGPGRLPSWRSPTPGNTTHASSRSGRCSPGPGCTARPTARTGRPGSRPRCATRWPWWRRSRRGPSRRSSTSSARRWRTSSATPRPASASCARHTGSSPRWAPRSAPSRCPGSWRRPPLQLLALPPRRRHGGAVWEPGRSRADRSALNCATGRPALHGRVRAPGSSTRGSCGAWSATTKAAAMTA